MRKFFISFINLFRNPLHEKQTVVNQTKEEPVVSRVQVRQVQNNEQNNLNQEAIFKYAKSHNQAKAAEKFNITIEEVREHVKAHRESLKQAQ